MNMMYAIIVKNGSYYKPLLSAIVNVHAVSLNPSRLTFVRTFSFFSHTAFIFIRFGWDGKEEEENESNRRQRKRRLG